MANPFDLMVARMDAVTVQRMGKIALIGGLEYDVVPAELIADMGPLTGSNISLVIFSDDYKPSRNDIVEYDGKTWKVTRYQQFNGKPQIWIE
ncbi:DNA breaking-rejoining protein [Budviciaceae bacterium CWB-B4]|uniref:DNA breaking-rejoining protein n=1 Tax=Limnobaculum xujianqingii TaxID=2738837 RepID=A0A9D7AGD2_9GAMM|nr:DNA breaking-rejoining protein [Limnobaculum xujianqingii]MBK5072228.1 DNA breaking-rejoining protein [Limnobaculum xujianqingii]MBK5175537.1 DNA breaking-rejoining protein [Limnobaculum xujianqingii]